jgi:tetraacyldisaccharide 4'-kinase
VQLGRDIDVLLVARDDLNERVLPSGRLRESLTAARRADTVLVPGTDEDAAVVSGTLQINKVFRVVPCFGEPLLVHPYGASVPQAAGRRAIAVAAIARPQRFFATLRSQGWDVVKEFAFRDHHWFGAADLDRVRRAARDEGADIVLTTAKDAVRLEAQDGNWAYLPMDVTIEPAAAFATWLREKLGTARTSSVREP